MCIKTEKIVNTRDSYGKFDDRFEFLLRILKDPGGKYVDVLSRILLHFVQNCLQCFQESHANFLRGPIKIHHENIL